jgi:hypothetical protein
MSKIYTMIENQVNTLLEFTMVDDSGNLQFSSLIPNPKWIKPIVQIITAVIYLAIVLFFGLYLWNFGLQPVFPGIIAKIDPANPAQAANPYTQLILTLLAIMMLS